MSFLHDRNLLDLLEQLPAKELDIQVWRVAWRSRHALDVGGGGRWNPPGRFDAVYTSLEADGAMAEVYHYLSRAPVFSSAEKVMYRIDARTNRTAVLDDPEQLRRRGLDPGQFQDVNPMLCQEIGSAAHLLEYDSLLVPSARWNCMNLVLFPDYIPLDSLVPDDGKPVNWPAWRDANEAEYARIRREGIDLWNKPVTRS